MKNLKKQGFTLVEIMIVVMIIGLLAAIAIPGFQRARQSTQENACINNLRVIDGAKQTYALEDGLSSTDTATIAVLVSSEYLDTEPICPIESDATPDNYTGENLGDIGTKPVCGDFETGVHEAFIPGNADDT